jgi:hypothetical protein
LTKLLFYGSFLCFRTKLKRKFAEEGNMHLTITFLGHMVSLTQTMLYLGLLGGTTLMSAVFGLRYLKQINDMQTRLLTDGENTGEAIGRVSVNNAVYAGLLTILALILWGAGAVGFDIITGLQGLVTMGLAYLGHSFLHSLRPITGRVANWISSKFEFAHKLRMLAVRGAVHSRIKQIRKASSKMGVSENGIGDRLEWLVKELLPSYIEDEAILASAERNIEELLERNDGSDSKWVASIETELQDVRAAHASMVKQIKDTPPFLDSILAGIYASGVDKEKMAELAARLDKIHTDFEANRESARIADAEVADFQAHAQRASGAASKAEDEPTKTQRAAQALPA